MLLRTVLLAFLLCASIAYATEDAPDTPQDVVLLEHEFDVASGIRINAVSDYQVESLSLLARVWGFLKYHHPRVTGGKANWDYELFRVMPAVLDANSRAEVQRTLSDWVHSLGVPKHCVTCAQLPESMQLRPDLAWIHDRKLLGKRLSRELESIYRDRPVGASQYYVSFYEDGNARFVHEQSYADMTFPDPGYRLLGLFRYWNAVEYWFPYRDLIGEDWVGVMREFIPRFVSANTESDYILSATALATRTGDGHAGVSAALDARPPLGDARLPVAVRSVAGHYVVQFCMDKGESGLLLGDSIARIDDTPIEDLINEITPYYPASNDAWRRHTISFNVLNGVVGPCRVGVERNGKLVEIESSRQPRSSFSAWEGAAHDLPGPIFRKLSDDVGYVWYGMLKPENVTDCIQNAVGTRCLLIDLRGYPNDFAAFELASHLIAKPTPHSCFTYPDSTNPGAFRWTEPEVLQPAEPRYTGKVAILVDETTLSSAEYSALVLRACPQAIVVGSTTAGADGNVSTIALPGGVRARMSGIGVFYPDHSPTQRIGIVPDLVIHPTIAGVREERDDVAEAAVRHLTGEKITIHSRYFGHH